MSSFRNSRIEKKRAKPPTFSFQPSGFAGSNDYAAASVFFFLFFRVLFSVSRNVRRPRFPTLSERRRPRVLPDRLFLSRFSFLSASFQILTAKRQKIAIFPEIGVFKSKPIRYDRTVDANNASIRDAGDVVRRAGDERRDAVFDRFPKR